MSYFFVHILENYFKNMSKNNRFPLRKIFWCHLWCISFMKIFAYPLPQFFRNYLEFTSSSKLTILNLKLIVLRKAKLAEFLLKNVFEIVKEIQIIYICLYCIWLRYERPWERPPKSGGPEVIAPFAPRKKQPWLPNKLHSIFKYLHIMFELSFTYLLSF